MGETDRLFLYLGEELASYGFGAGHPFGPDRLWAFRDAAERDGLLEQVVVCEPVLATRAELEAFHTPAYVDRVERQSANGEGYLDAGDTPAFPGIYEAGRYVVGSTVDALRRVMAGDCSRAFVPIAGLHHARRDSAAGFCVFNDCGVAIEILRSEFGLDRIAYVDIDAHHGDGVFYAFEDDPGLGFADLHEDGRFLYPGTGHVGESGTDAAKGTKLNVPMPPNAGDEQFFRAWDLVEKYLRYHDPDFILFQCGADSLAGDPITHLRYTENAHAHAAKRLRALADEMCGGRLLALGGGGYNRDNLARAWVAVGLALA